METLERIKSDLVDATLANKDSVSVNIEDLKTILSAISADWVKVEKLFKAKFQYRENKIGASRWLESIRAFSAVNAKDLHAQIDAYIEEMESAPAKRWHDTKLMDIELPPTE